jgi:aflatoxin B1 aldehyde reductase
MRLVRLKGAYDSQRMAESISMRTILGTMTIGPQVSAEDTTTMLKRFAESGRDQIDTAYVYNEGDTEKILGQTLKRFPANAFRISTKVNPRVTGKLDRQSIIMQLNASLDRLGVDAVHVLYLHFPDPTTPIDETLETCAELHSAGKINELGLSNFPAWKVVDIWHKCSSKGWIPPTVYQGLYNALSRKVENELLPALRHLGVRFNAYNPLAGGLLTGKHRSFQEEPRKGRFALRESYRKRYWKETFLKAVDSFTTACKESQIEPVEAALRWLSGHSQLDASKGDGIILGASTVEQLEQNLAVLTSDELPEPVLAALDAAWEGVRPESPEYFRPVTG